MRMDMIVFFIWMLVVVLSTFGTALLATRMSTKRREKAAEILRIYAERGEAPPQSVIDGLATLRGSDPNVFSKPPKPETRGRHFSEVASCTVIAIGAAGIAWWRAPEPGHNPGGLMILAIVAALIFAAGAVWHLVTALQIRNGQ